MFTDLFRKKTDFYSYAYTFIANNQHMYHAATIKSYRSNLSKLQRFSQKIKIEDIDRNFLLAFQKHMIVDLKNRTSTYNKSLTFVRTMLNHAKREGIIKQNKAFENFKISKTYGNRAYLSPNELKKLHAYYHETNLKGVKNVLGYFLFACYTGLRFSDIQDLRPSDIQNDIIVIEQHKTGTQVKIPLINKAKELTSFYTSKDKRIFESISNQKTNDHLKRIAKDCNINKRLSFHVARHTFATLGLTLGIPLEVISKLLGHTDIKTTQIYAHFRDDLLVSEMKKFENLEVLA